MRRQIAWATAALLAVGAAAPGAADAHALVQRSDLPIPEWLFGWAAAVVLVLSFVALASLWPEPKLQDGRWRALPGSLSRVLTSRAVEVVCGAIGVFLVGVVVYAGLKGVPVVTANIATTFVYVIFWVGLVPASVLFGDIYKAFNPWRALGRTVGFVSSSAAGTDMPPPLAYPKWLGRWPAAVGLFIFVALELQVFPGGNKPHTIAIATLAYSAVTFVAMVLFGVEKWIERGETFSVYYNLFSRLSIFERREREIGLRLPLSGLFSLEPMPGTVMVLAVMIGTVSFDALGEAPLWTSIVPHLTSFFKSLGFSFERSFDLTFGIGTVAMIALVYGFYQVGIAGARSVGGNFTQSQLAQAFVPSLVPIALAYVSAHYFTFLLYQGQAIIFLASDPLGHGSDIFGTADRAINYGLVNSSQTWYLQVAFVVAGHVAGLMVAHDRALTLYDNARQAVRSQYWMLVVMVGFTSLALWLLSQANQ